MYETLQCCWLAVRGVTQHSPPPIWLVLKTGMWQVCLWSTYPNKLAQYNFATEIWEYLPQQSVRECVPSLSLCCNNGSWTSVLKPSLSIFSVPFLTHSPSFPGIFPASGSIPADPEASDLLKFWLWASMEQIGSVLFSTGHKPCLVRSETWS